MIFRKIAYSVLIVLLITVLGLQIVQIVNGGKAKFEPYNYFLYRSPEDMRYYALNGKTGRIELQSDDPVWLIETVMERVPTNSRVVFGGSGGWYLDRTLTIKGKKNGDPASESRGLQEVIFDASQIEFVMHQENDKARDFIVIDTVVGSDIRLGVIVADPDDGFAALRIKPTLPAQYSGTVGAFWSKVNVKIIDGSGSGVGLMLDGSSAKDGIQYMQVDIGSIGNFRTNVLVNPGIGSVFGNEIKTVRNITMLGGVGIQDGVPPDERYHLHQLYNNHYIIGVSAVGGIGLSIYGNYSQYDLNVTEGDAGKIAVLQPLTFYNVLTGNAKLSFIGYTDNSGNDTNRFSGWRP